MSDGSGPMAIYYLIVAVAVASSLFAMRMPIGKLRPRKTKLTGKSNRSTRPWARGRARECRVAQRLARRSPTHRTDPPTPSGRNFYLLANRAGEPGCQQRESAALGAFPRGSEA